MKWVLTLTMAMAGVLSACGGGSGGETNAPVPPTYAASSGVAQKGPLIKGSIVTAQELDATLSPTGKQYSYQTTTDLGAFSPNANFGSPYVGVLATGYYYDEVLGTVSGGPVTLYGYDSLADSPTLNVNLLTTLAYQRISTLMAINQVGFESARAQAEREVLLALGIRTISTPSGFGALDLAASGDANDALAAVSAMFVNGRTSGQLSQLIANFQSDIADNGVIDSAGTRAALVSSASNLNADVVASNLSTAYAGSGKRFAASNITDWLDQAGDGVIGRYRVSLKDAAASTATRSASGFPVGAPDAGGTITTINGVLWVNGAITPTPYVARAGDNLALELTSGSNRADVVSGFILSGGHNIFKYTVQTRPLGFSLLGHLPPVGVPQALSLSADGAHLFVASTDSAGGPFNGDGGLYIFSTLALDNPLSHFLLPAPGYTAVQYNAAIPSSDARTVYVASAEQEFQIIDSSAKTAPVLEAIVPTRCQATGLAVSQGGPSAFVGTSCNELWRVDVGIPASPDVVSRLTGLPVVASGFALSADGGQLAIVNQGYVGMVDTSVVDGFGAVYPVVLPGGTTNPQAGAYLNGRHLALVDATGIEIIDLSDPAHPASVGQVSFESAGLPPAVQGTGLRGGAYYVPGRNWLYAAIGSALVVVDVSDPAHPVIRGATLLTVEYTSAYTGLTASSDGATVYVALPGAVAVYGVQ